MASTQQSVGYQYSYLENQLIETVKQSIRNELYSNAAFLCERLYAEVKNEDVKLLLAECYLGKSDTILSLMEAYSSKWCEKRQF